MCGHHRDRHVLTHSFPTRRSSDLRFLCISCTNLDEFFEIRAATVRHAQDFEMPPAPDGLPPAVVLRRIHERAAELVEAQYACWNRVLRPALSEARSEEHTSELQSLMRISYAVFCLKKKKKQ